MMMAMTMTAGAGQQGCHLHLPPQPTGRAFRPGNRVVSDMKGKLPRTEKQKAHLVRLHKTWNGSPDNKAQLAKLHKTRNGSPEHKTQFALARKKAHETWNGSPENLAQLARLNSSPEHEAHLERLNKAWSGSPENKTHLAQAGRKSSARPTWPEARFYGLLFGWFDGAIKGFYFQEVIPTKPCNHRVDARFGKTIFELDGGGHHAFADRHEHDRLVDEAYASAGYRVVRANDASTLFLRALQVTDKALPQNLGPPPPPASPLRPLEWVLSGSGGEEAPIPGGPPFPALSTPQGHPAQPRRRWPLHGSGTVCACGHTYGQHERPGRACTANTTTLFIRRSSPSPQYSSLSPRCYCLAFVRRRTIRGDASG